MTVSYQKLWTLLEMSELNKKDLQQMAQLGSHTMTKLNKREIVSMEIVLKICKVLHCDISEIMEVAEDI